MAMHKLFLLCCNYFVLCQMEFNKIFSKITVLIRSNMINYAYLALAIVVKYLLYTFTLYISRIFN